MTRGQAEDGDMIAMWLRKNGGPHRVPLGTSGGARIKLRKITRRARYHVEPPSEGDPWFAIRTKIKCELKAHEELRDAGFEVYLPERKWETFDTSLKVWKMHQCWLYPRYLFLIQPAEANWMAVRSCSGVEDVLPGFPMEPEPVPTKDVLTVRSAQEELLFDDTRESRRRRGETKQHTLAHRRSQYTGRTVRIKDGPFSGFDGEVEVVESLERLKVCVSLFGRPTPVALEFGQIDQLPPEALDRTREAA